MALELGAVLEATLEEVPRAATVAPEALTVGAISGLVALIEAANASKVVVVTALEATLAIAWMVAMKVLEAALEVEAERKTAVEKCWKRALQSCNEPKMERQGSWTRREEMPNM
jgi:predicted lysophospholipase L1 biosynthesis ABC-type transport system permease subunit